MITVNGKTKTDYDEIPVAEMLEREGFDRSRIALEINGVIISKRDYNETLLHSGDSIEVVSFVGGG